MSDQDLVPTPSRGERLSERREQAARAARAVQALLAVPALERHLGVNMLARIATDAAAPIRERRRASEVLAASEFKLLEVQANLAGARDLALSDLGAHPAQMRATAQVAVNVETGAPRLDADWWREWQCTPEGRAFVTAQLQGVMIGVGIEEIVEAGVREIERRQGAADGTDAPPPPAEGLARADLAVGCFRPDRLPQDPEAVQARRDARLTLLVAVCALRGQGGSCDPATMRAIAEDPRMTPRLQRRAATVLLRLGLPPGLGLAWNRGRS